MKDSDIRFVCTEKMLRELGIGRNRVAFTQISVCLEIIAKDPARMTNICEDVYAVAALRLGCPVGNVERNLRNAIFSAWKRDRSYFDRLAGFTVRNRPSVSEFLDMVLAYAQEHDDQVICQLKNCGTIESDVKQRLTEQAPPDENKLAR